MFKVKLKLWELISFKFNNLRVYYASMLYSEVITYNMVRDRND